MKCSPAFRYVLAFCWLAVVFCAPASAQRIQSVSVPVGSMDATSHPLDDNAWTVSAPPFPFDVQKGIGVLVNPLLLPGNDNFVLHDHQYVEPHVPDPARAVITFRFDQSVAVSRIEVVQHQNGIAQVEGFVGDSLEALTTIGAVFGPLGDVQGESVFAEFERHTFDFNNGLPGRVFQLIVRKTSLVDGWASYRIYPIDADGMHLIAQGDAQPWRPGRTDAGRARGRPDRTVDRVAGRLWPAGSTCARGAFPTF